MKIPHAEDAENLIRWIQCSRKLYPAGESGRKDDPMDIMTFDFEGAAQERRGIDNPNEPTAMGPSEKYELVSKLNERSDEVAQEIQREAGRIFRPFSTGSVAVQAEIRFSEGSLVVAGTLMIVGALGTIGAQAAQQALVGTLSKLLETMIQRVAQRWLRRETPPSASRYEPFEVHGQMHIAQLDDLQPDAQENTQPVSRDARDSSPRWLFPTLAITTFVNTVLLAVLLTMQIIQAG